MTDNFCILIDDADRERNPGKPWTATLSVGATPNHFVEARGIGENPRRALFHLLSNTEVINNLLDVDPDHCPDCGVMAGTEGYRTWHDSEGNCYSHRRPV